VTIRGERFASSIVAAAHASSPNLVGANEQVKGRRYRGPSRRNGRSLDSLNVWQFQTLLICSVDLRPEREDLTVNLELLTALKKVAKRRARLKLSRNDALQVLIKEGINNSRGGLTKEYGGPTLKKVRTLRRK